MIKRLRKISIILIATMIVSVAREGVLASGTPPSSQKQSVEVSQNVKAPSSLGKAVKVSPAKIKEEDISKREKNVKQFLKEDMSYEALVYPEAVHYLSNGKLEDVDNTLVSKTDANGQQILENKNASYKIDIAKNAKSKQLVKILKDGYDLAWSVAKVGVGASSDLSNVKEEDFNDSEVKNLEDKKQEALSKLPEEDKKKAAPNVTSEVKFQDIKPGVDLDYQVRSEKVKETIILKQKTKAFQMSFMFYSNTLTAELQKDKSIIFYDKNDKNKKIMKMPALFMYDSKNKVNHNINVTLQNTAEGILMTIKADSAWLSSDKTTFPVKIDPPLETAVDGNKILDVNTDSSSPDENLEGCDYIQVGRDSNGALFRTYSKTTLPTLTPADMVTYAAYGMGLYTDNPNETVQVNVYKVTSDWKPSTITYNNAPSFDTTVQDYQKVTGYAGTPLSWDITNIVKDWYATGQNYGLMFKNQDEATNGFYYNEFYSEDYYYTDSTNTPYMIIDYVNASGIENYYTYHTQEVEKAGISYTNDYTGNVVLLHNDIEMSGNRLPISIKHIFNSDDKAADIGYGSGWRLNVSQSITPVKIDGTNYYEYCDEDSTKHYFKGASDTWDESGINLKLTKNADGTYFIKDKSGNTLNFRADGVLVSTSDSNGNAITYSYGSNGAKPEKITDPSGRNVKLNYVNGKLDNIVDAAGRTAVKYGYSGNNLTTITYYDSTASSYSYDSAGNLKNVTDSSGYRLTYSYDAGLVPRVNQVLENNTDGTQGSCLNISYGYNKTVFTDVNGNQTTYVFNNSGNTISIKSDDGSVKYYGYLSGGTVSNKLSEQSNLERSIINFVKDPGAELKNGSWTAGSWTGSTGASSVSTSTRYMGLNSLKINKTNTTQGHYFTQDAVISKGQTYTFSAYVKTDSVTSANGGGAQLIVNYKNNVGATLSASSKYINGTKDWSRIEVTVTVPSDSASNTITILPSLKLETGTAYFDNLQLENDYVANSYNLVDNADFRYGAGGWSTIGTDGSDGLVSYTGADIPKGMSSSVYKLNGTASAEKRVYKYVNAAGTAGDKFILSGWGKGQPVSFHNGYFQLEIGFLKTDGTVAVFNLPFNGDSKDWQYISDGFTAPCDYTNVYVGYGYHYNANIAYFTGLQLYKDSFGTTYSYDASGNTTAVTDAVNNTTSASYDSQNNATSVTDSKNNSVSLGYDTKHNILSSTSAENISVTSTYDSYGNVTETKIGNDSTYIKTTNGYSASGQYLTSASDGAGNTVSSSYDEAKGTLLSVTDAASKTTTYGYDSMDRLTSVSKTASGTAVTNSYTYENNRLKTITHNNFNYIFGYDSLGNNTTINVGSQNLVTNSFEARTSRLLSTLFGNNQKVGFDYDSTGRMITKKYNDAVKFKYEYDAKGNLAKKEDLANNVTSRYIYTSGGNLVEASDSNGNDFGISYDANGSITQFQDIARNDAVSYGYNKDGRITQLANGSSSMSYGYDALGRLTSKNIVTGGNQFNTSLTYKPGINGSSSDLVNQITNNGNAITYTYDVNNNIASYTRNGKTISFTYDELNQLIRENNQELNKTITYSYDAGGNLMSKNEYAYTTGSPGTPTAVLSYTYGDSNWKDKLTNYNGKAITYDAIGNPLTYDGWNYSWEAGRQLSGMSKTGTSISFSYDDNGIRTSKTVNGVTTNYVLFEGRVIVETNPIDTIKYSYDPSGTLVSINLNGIEYFYEYNASGDIIGLVDASGAEVVSYVYDSWGKLISTTGSLASTVGAKNPYRFKGYRYDSDTGLYYLQSRYYSPELCRFINADDTSTLQAQYGQLLGSNLFAYCKNNAINYSDPKGYGIITVYITQDFIRDFYTASASVIFGLIGAMIVVMVGATAGLAMTIVPIIAGGLGWIMGGSFARSHINYAIRFSISVWFLPTKIVIIR